MSLLQLYSGILKFTKTGILKMNKFNLLGAASCAMLLSASAFADAGMSGDNPGDMMVRVRAVHLNWDNSSSVAGLAAQNKTIPEVDLSYFFTKNIATELILTYPQKVNVNLGATPIGSLKALPPTLTVQYHFLPDSPSFRPYVGAGINYTNFSSYSLSGGAITGSSSSWGGALQAGFDIPLTSSMTFNVDIKKLYINNDLRTAGGPLTSLKLNPLLLGVGLGWKF